ncbi:hypothetical protein FACS189426_22400 [Bacteroidia bacterium]|nr:hypothetical protein FACS189426_22400 [Bacteroidia bacterium]
MKKFVLFITLGLLIVTYSAIGDSWSAYTSDFSFVSDKLNLNVKLPK